jgi:hypothetical protein
MGALVSRARQQAAQAAEQVVAPAVAKAEKPVASVTHLPAKMAAVSYGGRCGTPAP